MHAPHNATAVPWQNTPVSTQHSLYLPLPDPKCMFHGSVPPTERKSFLELRP